MLALQVVSLVGNGAVAVKACPDDDYAVIITTCEGEQITLTGVTTTDIRRLDQHLKDMLAMTKEAHKRKLTKVLE